MMEVLDRHPGWYEASGYEARDAILEELRMTDDSAKEPDSPADDSVAEPAPDEEPANGGEPAPEDPEKGPVIEDDEETP